MLVGSWRWISGNALRTSPMTVSGFEVGVAKMPMKTAFSPSKTEDESALSGPSSMVAKSSSRIRASPRDTTTSLPNAAGLSRAVSALIVVWTKSPFTWPAAVMKLLLASAFFTSMGVTPRAAILSGLSQMRMAKVWPPRICALATPLIVCSLGCTTRVR